MVPRSGKRSAVLLVDVINHFEFPGGDRLLQHANAIVPSLLALRRAAHADGMPVIYANDNFGDWRSDFRTLLARCSRRGAAGADFVRKLTPSARDYFVLKPANSAFYCTTLEPLLQSLGARKLIVGGLTSDNCVLFTAHDAYLRGYRLHVPEDCVAAQSAADTRRAIEQMRIALKADTRPSARRRGRGRAREP